MIEAAEPTVNEYLDRYNALVGAANDPLDLDAFAERRKLVAHYAWAIPTDEAIEAIAKLAPILEVGAGAGYWKSLIQARGVEILAYDKGDDYQNDGIGRWSHVMRGTPETIPDELWERTLFLCWPPYEDPMGEHALERHRGEYVAYVGEGPGGCTGTEQFHDLLALRYEVETTVGIPSWLGLHDYLTIYRRRM